MKELKSGVYWVGATDWITRNIHGNELSTHKGTTYNSYLIKDEKTVLIDTVWEPLTKQLLEHISEVTDLSKINYVVMNHGEPDHSGALPAIMEYIPNATVIVSKKGLETATRYYQKEWNFKVVSTGDKINIGKNELVFIEAPMLHWPDSMFTYLTGENILFSNDAFGQHYASSSIFSDEVDENEVNVEALKYYANILTPFSRLVTKKIDELKELKIPIDIIAPAHGVIWRKNPMWIVERYYEWAAGKSNKSVVIAYNSMWEATHKMADFIAKGLEEAGVEYKIFNVATCDKSDLLAEVFKAKGIMLGSSTINNGIFPSILSIIEDLIGLKFEDKVGAAFGSYGWSGESPDILTEYLKKARIKVIDKGLKIKYMPDENDAHECVAFGNNFAERMLEEF